MAGHPRVKRVLEDLTLLAQAELGGELAEPTALDYALSWLEDGGTMIGLAFKLQAASAGSSAGAYDPVLNGGAVARMLRKKYGDQPVDVAFSRARARGSHASVESTHEIADEPVASSEDASRARNRIGTRQWAASAYAKDVFGQRGQAPVVNVNLGLLHLDALRKRALPQVEVNLAERQLAAPTEDAVLVEDEDVIDEAATS